MAKKLPVITFIISLIAVALAAAALIITCKSSCGTKEDTQYVLYLGTNDKDTVQPVFTPEEAKQQAEAILLKHFGGYTIQEANGGWIDGEKVFTEYTLVIHLSDTDIDAVHAAAKDMIKTFNQSSVLIQSNKTTTEFYEGK